MEAIQWGSRVGSIQLGRMSWRFVEGKVKGRHSRQRKEQLQSPGNIWFVREVAASVDHRVFNGRRKKG